MGNDGADQERYLWIQAEKEFGQGWCTCIWPCVNLNNLNWLKNKYGFCYHVRWHAAISALQHSQTNKGQVCIK